MVRSRSKDGSYELDEANLAALRRRVFRRAIDGREFSAVVDSARDLMGGVFPRIDCLVVNGRAWKRAATVEGAKALFGLDRRDSSLMKPRLEWKMSLSERISTETLARLLNSGGERNRARRIETFLRALGFRDDDLGIGPKQMGRFQVFSEVPAHERRIDLKVVWNDAEERERVLVIEAKFEHVITDGQLRCYRDSTKEEHPRARRFHLILALHEDAMRSVDDPKGKWRFCSWRDLWLRFEVTRPCEDDLNLQLFLHALWRRIGQLNPKDCYAGL